MTIDHLVSDPVPAMATPPGRDAAHPLAALGAIAGLGAVAGSSCCVLPLVLAGMGAGSAFFSGLEFLAAYRMPVFGAALAFLTVAWAVYWRRSRAVAACAATGACARPETSRRTAVVLGIATLSVALAAAWGLVEPVLLRAVQ
jgi:mercuric ion transport protein